MALSTLGQNLRDPLFVIAEAFGVALMGFGQNDAKLLQDAFLDNAELALSRFGPLRLSLLRVDTRTDRVILTIYWSCKSVTDHFEDSCRRLPPDREVDTTNFNSYKAQLFVLGLLRSPVGVAQLFKDLEDTFMEFTGRTVVLTMLRKLQVSTRDHGTQTGRDDL